MSLYTVRYLGEKGQKCELKLFLAISKVNVLLHSLKRTETNLKAFDTSNNYTVIWLTFQVWTGPWHSQKFGKEARG